MMLSLSLILDDVMTICSSPSAMSAPVYGPKQRQQQQQQEIADYRSASDSLPDAQFPPFFQSRPLCSVFAKLGLEEAEVLQTQRQLRRWGKQAAQGSKGVALLSCLIPERGSRSFHTFREACTELT